MTPHDYSLIGDYLKLTLSNTRDLLNWAQDSDSRVAMVTRDTLIKEQKRRIKELTRLIKEVDALSEGEKDVRQKGGGEP